jgi:hypothetical protein
MLRNITWVVPEASSENVTITDVRCARISGIDGGAFQVKDNIRLSSRPMIVIPSEPLEPSGALISNKISKAPQGRYSIEEFGEKNEASPASVVQASQHSVELALTEKLKTISVSFICIRSEQPRRKVNLTK